MTPSKRAAPLIQDRYESFREACCSSHGRFGSSAVAAIESAGLAVVDAQTHADLLAACKAFVNAWERGGQLEPCVVDCVAAVAKAEGR